VTVTDSTFDLGQLAILAEGFAETIGAIAEISPTANTQREPDGKAWTVTRPDALVMLVEIGSPSPDLLTGLLTNLGESLGAAPVECEPDAIIEPVDASVVAILDGEGNGVSCYFTPLSNDPALTESAPDDAAGNSLVTLGMLREVPLELSAEIGRTRMSVAEILQLNVGSVIELDRTAGSPVDVVVNGSLIARGEVVVIDDEYGVRVTEIVGRVSDNT